MQELARASFQNHLFYFRTISQGTRKSNLKKKILQIFIKSVLGNDRLVFKVYDNLNLDAWRDRFFFWSEEMFFAW